MLTPLRPPLAGLWIILAAGVGAGLLWLLGLRLLVARRRRREAAAAQLAAGAGKGALPLYPGAPTNGDMGNGSSGYAPVQQPQPQHQHQPAHHSQPAYGVAFKQTVSIYGAQVLHIAAAAPPQEQACLPSMQPLLAHASSRQQRP